MSLKPYSPKTFPFCFLLFIGIYTISNGQDLHLLLKELKSIDKIQNVCFFVNEYKLFNKELGQYGEIVNLNCEIKYNLHKDVIYEIFNAIDTIYAVGDDLIGNCWDSNNNYDSYLLVDWKEMKEGLKIFYYCRNYKRGIIIAGGNNYYVIFKANVSKKVEKMASEIRTIMCPCKNIMVRK
jgi:hypothetical protein